jgi:hypothetical protein
MYYITYSASDSVEGAILSAAIAAVFSFVLCLIFNMWLRFKRHYKLFRRLNDHLNPPSLCPVVLADAYDSIFSSIEDVKNNILTPLRGKGYYVTWKRYGELLSSSLLLNENKFMATCLLTPVQFMSPQFKPYLLAQEVDLKGGARGWLGRRIRILAVHKDQILEDRKDASKKELMKSFFKWHKKIRVPVFFISWDKFKEMHKSGFGALELNDFVYFALDSYLWVIGVNTSYSDPPDIESQNPRLRIIESPKDDVDLYQKFILTLKKNACRVKSFEALIKWAGSEDIA